MKYLSEILFFLAMFLLIFSFITGDAIIKSEYETRYIMVIILLLISLCDRILFSKGSEDEK